MYTLPMGALRADLAATLRRAEAGESTVVTVSGRPVARVAPLSQVSAPSLAALVASGAVIAPRRRAPISPRSAVAVWSGVRIDRVLRELRG